MCFSFVFRKERDTAAQIANMAKADPSLGQKRKRWGGGRGGGMERRRNSLPFVSLATLPHRFSRSVAPYDLRLDVLFFFNLKGMRERLIAGYLLYETDETLLKNTPKNLLRKLADVLYLLRTSDVSN